MLHRRYADGSPRPLLRGWLHLLFALTHTGYLLGPHKAATRPAFVSIAGTAWASALLHVYPWQSVSNEAHMTRLDRAGILMISMWSYLTPTLTAGAHGPGWPAALTLIVAPHTIGLMTVLAGCSARWVFLGSALAQLTISYTWINVPEATHAHCWSLVTTMSYAGALFIHKVYAGATAVWWGYHEWMHLIVTVGFYGNIQCVLAVANMTPQ